MAVYKIDQTNRDYRYCPVQKGEAQIGMLLRQTWGCTMQGHHFYEIVEIKGNKVFLTIPECGSEGNQDGYQWINGPAKTKEIVRLAKFTARGLMACGKPGQKHWDGKDIEWKIQRSWPALYRQEIGEREHFYGD